MVIVAAMPVIVVVMVGAAENQAQTRLTARPSTATSIASWKRICCRANKWSMDSQTMAAATTSRNNALVKLARISIFQVPKAKRPSFAKRARHGVGESRGPIAKACAHMPAVGQQRHRVESDTGDDLADHHRQRNPEGRGERRARLRGCHCRIRVGAARLLSMHVHILREQQLRFRRLRRVETIRNEQECRIAKCPLNSNDWNTWKR